MPDFPWRSLLRSLHWGPARSRWYQTAGLKLRVFPGLWHPGHSRAARLLSAWTAQQAWAGRVVLDLCCGPGLLALQVAQQGGRALAIDREEAALLNLRENARRLQLPVEAHLSDLLHALPPQPLDVVLCVPPWQPCYPQQAADFDHCCGEQYEWYQVLFAQMADFAHPQTRVVLALPSSAEVSAICAAAQTQGWSSQLVAENYKAAIFAFTPDGLSSPLA